MDVNTALQKYKADEISLEEMEQLIEEEKQKFAPPKKEKRKTIKDERDYIVFLLAERDIKKIISIFKTFYSSFPWEVEEDAELKKILQNHWENEEFTNIIKLLSSFNNKVKTYNEKKEKKIDSALMPNQNSTNYYTHGCYVDQLRSLAGYEVENEDTEENTEEDDDLLSQYDNEQSNTEETNTEEDDDDDIDMVDNV